MDPEPGRCRRTDGNKWRCRKDVVPDTKYCERHIHRGRSRKHVESSKVTLPHNTPTITYASSDTPTTTFSRKTSQKIKSHDPDETSPKFPTPVPENQETKILSSLDESKDLTCTATAMITSSANGKSKITSVFVENDMSSRENSDDRNGMDAGSHKDKNNKRNSTDGNNNDGPVTPELSISAKSVVNTLTIESNKVCEHEHRDAIAEEPQRCRRTDGKRWRCSKEAIPQQKYCGSHMHRGSKRCRSSSEVETVTATSAALNKIEGLLSTDLSISPPKCTQPIVINLDSSTSGSSSDATTVTDTEENTSISHILCSSR